VEEATEGTSQEFDVEREEKQVPWTGIDVYRRALKVTYSCLAALLIVLPMTQAHAGASRVPLVVGWFSSYKGSTNLSTYSTNGVNVVELTVWPTAFAATDSYLANARRHHVQILVGIPNRFIRQLNVIQKIVARYRDNPTVWGWYMYDEPDFWGTPAPVLVRAYQTIKHLDSRPVVVTFMSGHCNFDQKKGHLDPKFLQTFDVLTIDHFVLFKGMHEYEDLGREEAYYAQCVRVARQYHKLGAIIILQAFGGLPAGKLTWRDPTLGEEQYMTWLSIRAGAIGVLYWSDFRADRQVFANVNKVTKGLSSGD
jgi:hypothetical protein